MLVSTLKTYQLKTSIAKAPATYSRYEANVYDHINDKLARQLKLGFFSVNFSIFYHIQVTVYNFLHLYYDDAQPSNTSFSSEIKLVQNGIAVTIKETIGELSR